MKIPEPARRGWTDVLECVDDVFRTREGKRGWSLARALGEVETPRLVVMLKGLLVRLGVQGYRTRSDAPPA